ncbi:MAG: GTPase [Planctomycetota bacterium]
MSGPETIVAVGSPPGRGWRGLIRVDGSAEGVASVIDGWCGAGTAEGLPVRVMTKVRLIEPALPALALRFAAGASYTGHDAAELQVVGHPAVLESLVERAIASGARAAEPGEFTYRAYVNGRLSLTQAEGVAATIEASNAAQLRAAERLRGDALGRLAREVVDEVGTALALVEAGIDFTDQENVVAIEADDLRGRLASAIDRLSGVIDGAAAWPSGEAVTRVAIVGPPSSGKSTLFNALLGRDRAVVDATPGTTRDAIAERCVIEAGDGRAVDVELIDTAGLDEAAALTTAGVLDRAAQAATRRVIGSADVVVRVRDGESPTPTLPNPLPKGEGARVIEVKSKADLRDTGEPLHVSAATGLRMAALREAIVDAAGAGVTASGEAGLALPAHAAAIGEAVDRLAAAQAGIGHDEVVAGEMRAALDALARLGGELTPDDVIGRVFSAFCVGK